MYVRHCRFRNSKRREGKIFILFIVMVPVLMGMTGLVIDGGLIMASYRQTQNAADAAALAGALAVRNGGSPSSAVTAYLSGNGMNLAQAATVNNPPLSGNYANPPSPLNKNNYVEVILTNKVNVFMITMIPGMGNVQNVTARAVAGVELVSSSAQLITLDPKPPGGTGLSNVGTATLKVAGRIAIDAEGAGANASGTGTVQYGTYTQGPASNVKGTANVESPDVTIVGGINSGSQNNYTDLNGQNAGTTVHTGALPVQDPLLHLPTPTTANGVTTTNDFRSSPVTISTGTVKGLPASWIDPTTGVVTLQPGIYESISINGGTVVFSPGIYVLSPQNKKDNPSLSISGNGTVTGSGVMFYNTGNDYSPNAGTPDSSDGSLSPNAPSSTFFGSISIGGGGTVNLSAPTSGTFSGMLIYQRRWNTDQMSIGGTGSLTLGGTLYAKWAGLSLGGTGTYSSPSQLIVGNVSLVGNSTITVNTAGQNLGQANQIFLVE
jgi:hypothetical protein